MRVAFLGLPLAALLLARDGHDVVYAGICRKGAIGARRLRRTLGERVEIMPKLSDPDVALRIRDAKPDLLVSWFWTKRIPAPILAIAPHGTVGVHPSLLPRHRGPDPCFWAIRENDAVTGVTAHRLEREYDTGAILGSRSLAIDPSWNAWQLARALDRPSLTLLREVVAAFARGAPPPERPQDEAQATSAPAPSEDELHLDPKKETAIRLERFVRAAAPFPGTWIELSPAAEGQGEAPESEIVVVTRAAVVPNPPRALEPGEAAVEGGVAVVRALEGGLALLGGRVVGFDGETAIDAPGLAALVARLSGRPALA